MRNRAQNGCIPVLLIAVIIALWHSVAVADGFTDMVADLSNGGDVAKHPRLGSCNALVTPRGDLRRPCTVSLADLGFAGSGVKLSVLRGVKSKSDSLVSFIESTVVARQKGKRPVTFRVIEVGGHANPDLPDDGWFTSYMIWTKLITDKEAAAQAAAGKLPQVSVPDSTVAIPGDTQTSKTDTDVMVSALGGLQGTSLTEYLSTLVERDVIVLGSANKQRYVGGTGARAIRKWPGTRTQVGGAATVTNEEIGISVVGMETRGGPKIPYVLVQVNVSRGASGGSVRSVPALFIFSVPN